MKSCLKLLALALLVACLFTLTSCGGGGPADSDGKAFVPESIRYTAAPAAAFGGNESARVIAVSADRQKLLIASPFDLYIWDVGTGSRIPVSFSAEEDLELLSLNMDRMLALGPNNKKLTEEQLEERRKAGTNYLAKQGQTRFTNVDQIMECYPRMIQIRAVCWSMGEHFVLVLDNNNLLGMFTLDMRTGAARMIPSDQGSVVFPTLCGDRMLSGAGITDLNTGETAMPEIPESVAKPDEDLAARPVLRLLPDGSIVALSRGANFTENMESNYYLRKPFETENSWVLLGSYRSAFSDSALYITGDGKFAAVSPPYYLQGPVIVNLETMEAQTLDTGDLVVIGEYDSGFICYSLRNLNAVRLDAASLKQTQLRQTGDTWPEVNITVAGALKSNGRDYCAQNAVIQGYFTADTK